MAINRPILFAIFLIGVTSAEKIILDTHSGQSQAWIEVSCIYNDDYNDFWVFGCPVNLQGAEDQYPTREGFWTPCAAQKCEIQYYAGPGVPQPKSLKLHLYLKGNAEILMSSKYGFLDEEFDNDLGKISKDDGEGWFEKEIDLTNVRRAMIFNFELLSSGDDILLLDKIEVDLGDDVTAPTDATPTTTSIPIEDDTVTLETANNYWRLWDVDCNYAEEYEDFWVYGCPINPKEEQDKWPAKGGYWSHCKAKISDQPYCRMRYLGNFKDSPIDKEAFSFRIFGNLDGDAQINVTLQDNPFDVNCNQCNILKIIGNDPDTDGQWIDVAVGLDTLSPEIVYVNIDLYPGEGQVLVEKVEVLLRERGEPSTTTQGTGSPETTTSVSSETSPDSEGTSPDSGGTSPDPTTTPSSATKMVEKSCNSLLFLIPLLIMYNLRF